MTIFSECTKALFRNTLNCHFRITEEMLSQIHFHLQSAYLQFRNPAAMPIGHVLPFDKEFPSGFVFLSRSKGEREWRKESVHKNQYNH